MSSSPTPSEIAAELGRSGLYVGPDFLNQNSLTEAREDLLRIQAEGGFHRAGIGHGLGHGIHEDVRRDEIHWLERTTENPIQQSLWQRFDLLKQALNRTLYLGLNDFEAHYASYPAGGFYQRHLDSFAQDNVRYVSIILYLNKNWKKADGGQLRVYSESSQTDIDPIGGTLVCFMSKESEHEVLPSFAPRLSIAGWYSRK